jgi:hypothetical protein
MIFLPSKPIPTKENSIPHTDMITSRETRDKRTSKRPENRIVFENVFIGVLK